MTPTMTASGASPRRPDRSATGRPLATNDDHGVVDQAAVQRYLDADPLKPYGFSGWVGPGTARRQDGQLRSAPGSADRRPGGGLADRPLRAAAGRRRMRYGPSCWWPASSARDIVLFPHLGGAQPGPAVTGGPATCAAAPDRRGGSAHQARRPDRFPGGVLLGYGPAAMIQQVCDRFGQRYRDLYYRLHAEVDGPIDKGAPRGESGWRRRRAECAPPTTAICWRARRSAPEMVQPL